MWWLGLGAALALPPSLAVLGPDGPLWVGTLPPGEDPAGRVVVVRSTDGALFVEEADLGGHALTWAAGRFTLDGQPLPAGDLAPLRLLRAGDLLVGIDTPGGGSRRYTQDEAGRLTGVEWPDGSRLAVRYDEQGRVRNLAGPGPRQIELLWQEGLTVRSPIGGITTIRAAAPGNLGSRAVEVVDGLGRKARTHYGEDARGVEVIVGWQDPRGRTTSLRRREGLLELEAGDGRRYVIEQDPAGRMLGMSLPGGSALRFLRDERGRLARSTDGSGRSLRVERDGAGRVVLTSFGARPWAFSRDEAGRVTGVVDPGGATTRLDWDRGGRLLGITDATGNRLQIVRDAGGRLLGWVERDGGKWVLERDLLGRLVEAHDPVDRRVLLRWDGAGRLSQVTDWTGAVSQRQRGPQGAVTRVVDGAGRATGLLRDGLGRLVGLARADGSRLRIERDLLGEIVAIGLDGERLEIDRDPEGRPLRAGAASWRWDSAGGLLELHAPGLILGALRDGAGLLRGLVSPAGWGLEIVRDPSGRARELRGTDGSVVIERDPVGRPTRQLTQLPDGTAQELRLRYDGRGLLSAVESPCGAFSHQRDPAGRRIRTLGPGGLAVGVDRDAAGVPALLRLPDGSLLRWSGRAGTLSEELVGRDGVRLGQRSLRLAVDGGVERIDEGAAAVRVRGARGERVAIEAGPETWSFTPDGAEGPGFSLALDRVGRWSEALVERGLGAWGLGPGRYAALRDAEGLLQGVAGAVTTAQLSRDQRGRLISVGGGMGGFAVSWDVLGRPAVLRGPDGVPAPVAWGPAEVPDAGRYLCVGGAVPRAYLWGPQGPVGWTGADQGVLVPDLDGSPRSLLDPAGAPLLLGRTPFGLPEAGAAGVVGEGGRLQLFAGGPIFGEEGLIDPLSGGPVDGGGFWLGDAVEVPAARLGDPDVWAPTSAWGDPIGLLVALGVVGPVDPGPWTAPLWKAVDPVEGLPAAIFRGYAAPGPVEGQLPLVVEPVLARLLGRVLQGGAPLDLREVVLAEVPELEDRLGIPMGAESERIAAIRSLPMAAETHIWGRN